MLADVLTKSVLGKTMEKTLKGMRFKFMSGKRDLTLDAQETA